jgi:hypothetical protein
LLDHRGVGRNIAAADPFGEHATPVLSVVALCSHARELLAGTEDHQLAHLHSLIPELLPQLVERILDERRFGYGVTAAFRRHRRSVTPVSHLLDGTMRVMNDPTRMDALREAVARVREAVLDGPGATSAQARRDAFAGRAGAPVVARYVELVRAHAYRVTDEDVDGLRGAGLDDDAIFELTVAAALGAAAERLEAGLALLREET